MTTKKYGNEISWSVGTECVGNGPYKKDNFYEQICCFAAGEYTVSCKDSYGDGWNGGYLEINGQKYCEEWSPDGGKLQENTLTLEAPWPPPPRKIDY